MAIHSNIFALEIPRTREAWWATVHGVSENQTRLTEYILSGEGGSEGQRPENWVCSLWEGRLL